MLADLETETRQAQRAELETVLAAEAFRRAPTLARILEYLCERQMAGETSIKEYEIAVQVMGRHSNFDPQQDGSVRVNLHHLRKKLRRYYETEGADHAVLITLPIGQSLPSFVNVATAASLPEEAAEPQPSVHETSTIAASTEIALPASREPIKIESQPVRTSLARWTRIAGLIAMMMVVAVAWFLLHDSRSVDPPTFVDAVFRVGCGRASPLRDRSGRIWGKDVDFEGGRAFDRKEAISGTSSDELYLQGREGKFSYTIPLPNASYELHLFFAETALRGEGFRLMHVLVNGLDIEQRFDPTSDAGAFATATEKVYLGVRPASDGKLHLNFDGINSDAFVNAIEIMPSNGDRMRPIRQTTLDRYYFDPSGTVWSPDSWFHGGRTISLQEVFPHIPLDGFYGHERFGNFDYSIPVVPSRTYSMTLYFQDLWFSQNPQKTTPFERREFNVSCNGKELLHQQNIVEEAGSGHFRLIKHFTGLTPSAQGKLVLAFRPTQNYATVNAIEVVEEPESAGNGISRP